MRLLLRARYPHTYAETYHAESLAGVIQDDRHLLVIMTEAIIQCGYEGKVGIYFDCAADCYYEPDIDKYVGHFMPGERSTEEQIALLKSYVDNFPIVSLEDPLHEDFEVTHERYRSWASGSLATTCSPPTSTGCVRTRAGACNSMVVKITQVGTVSEALAACRRRWRTATTCTCGSRGDRDSVGDFAVGLNAGQVRRRRNRLLDIEKKTWAAPRGWARPYKGVRNRQ